MNLYKYPRTPHLPFSPSVDSDDVVLDTTQHFFGKEVIVSIKMDGECSTIYSDGSYHARSIDSQFANHPSRDWIKKYKESFYYEIPVGWRICGENMYAKHSIHYHHLKNYFLVYSIWNEKNECLSWKDTIEWCELLKLNTVDVIYSGIYFNDQQISDLCVDNHDGDTCEGFVVRLKDSFHFNDFQKSIAKYVRKNHIKSSKHWMKEEIIKNELIKM